MKKIISLVILALFSVFAVFPIWSVLSTSFQPIDAFQTTSLSIWNESSSLLNYKKLFLETPFLIWVRNSLLVSCVVTLTGVLFAAFSGYVISRFRIKGKKIALLILLTTQMFPATMFLLPFFIVLSKLHLINSFWGLFIIYSATALPFCIWQMKGYFDTIPRELEEAARVDGCNEWQTFWRVIMPISLPALVITALFNFLAAWSEYMVAAVILLDPSLYTLPLGLKSFQSSLATQWGLYAAGSIVVSVPVVALFLALSKYLVSGLTMGSVKG